MVCFTFKQGKFEEPTSSNNCSGQNNNDSLCPCNGGCKKCFSDDSLNTKDYRIAYKPVHKKYLIEGKYFSIMHIKQFAWASN